MKLYFPTISALFGLLLPQLLAATSPLEEKMGDLTVSDLIKVAKLLKSDVNWAPSGHDDDDDDEDETFTEMEYILYLTDVAPEDCTAVEAAFLEDAILYAYNNVGKKSGRYGFSNHYLGSGEVDDENDTVLRGNKRPGLGSENDNKHRGLRRRSWWRYSGGHRCNHCDRRLLGNDLFFSDTDIIEAWQDKLASVLKDSGMHCFKDVDETEIVATEPEPDMAIPAKQLFV
jgi:hypothetical protein